MSCIVCNELFHASQKCAKLTAPEVEVAELKKPKPRLQFKLTDCDSSGKVAFGEHLNSVKNILEEQFDTLKSNSDSLNKSFSKDIKGLESDSKNIKESCDYIYILNEEIDTDHKDI
ncbi:hypothetical protein QAD02_002470 [Eretmocerus hayati]|uniref:Uncharacterized protein n=2 Tax=Eretmocerus hayati TaxID=131215 RepID=A0ACC2NJ67_9HYME|nr:hypothetical protein QAD02_002469 [Eretmocerus hayati]KAJ8671211.1 hypothetical protein QAD02_002470 [Eretmocerus hayati]